MKLGQTRKAPENAPPELLPAFDMVQLEVTSRCNLSCRTCLKNYYQQDWLERDFDFSLFARLLPQLKLARAIHLQGWGEPLLVDNLDLFIRLVKEFGIPVSFTTNGTCMTEAKACRIVRSGVDGVTFSMAGITAATHDRLRGSGTFYSTQQAIKTLLQVKNKLQRVAPKVAISYLLTRESVLELPEAVQWARKAGVDLFSTVNLSQAGSREQEMMQFFFSDKKRIPLQIRKVQWKTNLAALFSRMKVDLHSFVSSPVPVCDKNPVNSLFIGADGSVSPCVFLSPPLERDVIWRDGISTSRQPRLNFGNLHEKNLKEIWNEKAYRDFRKIFTTRLDLYTRAMSTVGFGMEGPEQLENALKDIRRGFLEVPPPSVCSCCLKMKGL